MFIKIKIIFLYSILTIVSTNIAAQKVKMLTSETSISIRGLSVVNNNLIWASGSEGTVGQSKDGGKSWKWMKVKGFEQTDFRDIEGFDNKTALIMGISEPGYILRTTDGGNTWKTVYQNNTKGIFLDAMDFENNKNGIVLGDPIDNHFLMIHTLDGGKNWQEVPKNHCPIADSGEACFASSGTNIRKLNKQDAVFISGGVKSSLFINDKKINLPIIQGISSTGANSIAVKNNKTMIIVGGDFTNKDDTTKNCVITTDGGITFTSPQITSHGYRSCVEYINKKTWISCGLNGIDISTDEGKKWNWISKESFNVCRKAKIGTAVFFAGAKGKIGMLVVK